jgi:hypothetical protein
MFRPNCPSSGVQVVMVQDSAPQCNAAFFPPIILASGYLGYVGCHQLYNHCNRRKENRTTVSTRILNHKVKVKLSLCLTNYALRHADI